MATVRAKFRCNSVTDFGDRNGRLVKLSPVTSGSEENKGFWNATPSGTLEMHINNEHAAEQFIAGKSYYLDFTPADE